MVLGSTVLELAIGMVFVYLLLSLLCSAINEYIEALLNYRGKNLRKGIELLLNDQDKPGANSIDLAAALYNHGLIRGLYRGKDGRKLPSYIPSRTFALALWNMASQGVQGGTTNLTQIRQVIEQNVPNKELKEALTTLIDDAKGNFDQAVQNIEDWYNAGMDRASGWYKRRVQMILLLIGFALSIVINADSINIGKALWESDTLRTSIVGMAEKASPPPAPAPTPTDPNEQLKAAQARFNMIRSQLDQTGLPLGWVTSQVDSAGNVTNANDPRRLPTFSEPNLLLLKLLGLILTGLAISQGAPFWFDLLNKFMVIRSTVKPREKSHDESSKDSTDDDDADGDDASNVNKHENK
jgi:hypothetical protein